MCGKRETATVDCNLCFLGYRTAIWDSAGKSEMHKSSIGERLTRVKGRSRTSDGVL